MQAQYESNIEQTYNADEWLDSDEPSPSKRDRKESKRVRQDDRRKSRELKRGEF